MCWVLSTPWAHSKHFSKWYLLLLLGSLCRLYIVEYNSSNLQDDSPLLVHKPLDRLLLSRAEQTCITNKTLQKWHVLLGSLYPKRKCDFCLVLTWIALTTWGQLCCKYIQEQHMDRCPGNEGQRFPTNSPNLPAPWGSLIGMRFPSLGQAFGWLELWPTHLDLSLMGPFLPYENRMT